MQEIKGYKNLATKKFYNYWIDGYTNEKDSNIKGRIRRFLLSGLHNI